MATATFKLNGGYDSYSGCDIVVTARLNVFSSEVDNVYQSGGKGGDSAASIAESKFTNSKIREKVYTLGSIQTISISTHQDKKPVRVIGSVNALDYTMGQRTIAGSLVFAVFDQHFATEMFEDLKAVTGKTFFLPDELPALDITISFANEYGKKSRMAVYGVRLINEGQVMSINDLYTENTYQFVATAMEPLRKGLNSGGSDSLHGQNTIVSSNNKPTNNYATGENIYTNNIKLNGTKHNSIELFAEIEQPLVGQEYGIVSFTTNPIVNNGKIKITSSDTHNRSYNINISSFNGNTYWASLPIGKYTAIYESDSGELSNTLKLTIGAINSLISLSGINDTPIIENVTNTSIKIMSNNISHTKAICINTNTLVEESTISLKNRECTFTDLTPDTVYKICTTDNNCEKRSSYATVKTWENDESLVTMFKTYVESNSNLLSKDIKDYDSILKSIIYDEDIFKVLCDNNDIMAKELLFMAIKYQNELVESLNKDALSLIAIKDCNDIFGNTFYYKNADSANIFNAKNNRLYYESTVKDTSKIVYNGKTNHLYNAIGIHDYNKSPKYYFYGYKAEDKSYLKNLFNHNDKLLNNDKTSAMTEEENKIINVYNNKKISLLFLNAPICKLDEFDNLTIDIDYRDVLGTNNNKYYLCISKIEEALDKTPIRKVSFTDNMTTLNIQNHINGITNDSSYAVWIEDENCNTISNCSFVANTKFMTMDKIKNYIYELELKKILGKLNTTAKKEFALFENDSNTKDLIHNMIAQSVSMSNDSFIVNLVEAYFSNFLADNTRFNEATFYKKNNLIDFKDNDSTIVKITYYRDSYKIETAKSEIQLDKEYTLIYAISNNPTIKSGYILFDNNNRILSKTIDIKGV